MCVGRALFAVLVGTATTVGGTGTTSAGATSTQAAGAASSSRQQQIQLSDLQNILSSMNGQSAQFFGLGSVSVGGVQRGGPFLCSDNNDDGFFMAPHLVRAQSA